MIFNSAEEQLLPFFDDLNIELQKKSSYDEEAIQNKLAESGKVNEFFACALQLAVVGWGAGNYGETTLEGSVIDVASFITENGGFVGNDLNANLSDSDITPRRLIRVFRWQIRKWMKENNTTSFLQKKYGNRQSARIKFEVFPMAEHLIEDPDGAAALIGVYERVDIAKNTNFANRVKMVFAARGVLES